MLDKTVSHYKILKELGKAGMDITKTGSTLGTVAYMSPEQAMGGEIDCRTDIWALGVVLYEMLSGACPFKGDFEGAVIYSILNEEPDSIRNFVPENSNLATVVEKCLQKEPAVRYLRVQELSGDLSLSQASKKSGGRGTDAKPQSRKKRPLTGRMILSIITLLFFCIGIYVVYNTFLRSSEESVQEPQIPSIAILYFENITGESALDHWRRALAELLTTDLSQSRYLRVTSADRLYQIFADHKLLELQ